VLVKDRVEAWIDVVAGSRRYSADDIEFIRYNIVIPGDPIPDKKWEFLTYTQQYRSLAYDRIGDQLEHEGLTRWDDDANLLLVLPAQLPLDNEEWLAAVEDEGRYSIEDIGFIVRNVIGDSEKYPDVDAVESMLVRLESDGLVTPGSTTARFELQIPGCAIPV
jgi:hypothetical protein